jgi:hypothetical protein
MEEFLKDYVLTVRCRFWTHLRLNLYSLLINGIVEPLQSIYMSIT